MTKSLPLPDRLRPKQRLRTKDGKLLTVSCTKKKNRDGKRLYRIKHEQFKVKSPRLWSRDELDAEGVTEW